MGTAEILANAFVGAYGILALALFAIALRAWAYARDGRTALLAMAFGLFCVKAVATAVILFQRTHVDSFLVVLVGVDVAILLGLYMASLR